MRNPNSSSRPSNPPPSKGAKRTSPLETTPRQAQRDKSKLRQTRNRLENEPTVDDTSTRSTLF
ncbi:MAG TPA: hypothetical protein VGM73_04590 [Candidatus Didemnitutus sp.]|jgi:hypothetical protein